jgi:hypothetical protein
VSCKFRHSVADALSGFMAYEAMVLTDVQRWDDISSLLCTN